MAERTPSSSRPRCRERLPDELSGETLRAPMVGVSSPQLAVTATEHLTHNSLLRCALHQQLGLCGGEDATVQVTFQRGS
jgi:hypothetical protein